MENKEIKEKSNYCLNCPIKPCSNKGCPLGNNIPGFIKESDLYICEGTYGSEEDMHKAIKNKHMTFKEAANLAKRGQVKELLLTHFSPSINDPEEFIHNAREVFENSHTGSDGEERTLNFKE